MKVQDCIASLRELAEVLPRPEYPWEDTPQFTPPAATGDVREYEQVAGFELPADVKEFFSLAGDVVGMSVHNGYWIGGIRKLIAIAREAHIPSTSGGRSIVPIATDGGGNVFFLSDAGSILRWQHETGELSEVSPSFSAFLERVAADWKAYVSDTPGWSYLV
ncbi:MAG: SMI1/KNR4 family protein [bacterium]|nr:SMI1/KNR4 family protein [bacterium]